MRRPTVARGGDELTQAGRILHLAEQAVIAHYDGGAEAAIERVARLEGAQLDPDLCTAFAANSDVILDPLDGPDMLASALNCEPRPIASVTEDELTFRQSANRDERRTRPG